MACTTPSPITNPRPTWAPSTLSSCAIPRCRRPRRRRRRLHGRRPRRHRRLLRRVRTCHHRPRCRCLPRCLHCGRRRSRRRRRPRCRPACTRQSGDFGASTRPHRAGASLTSAGQRTLAARRRSRRRSTSSPTTSLTAPWLHGPSPTLSTAARRPPIPIGMACPMRAPTRGSACASHARRHLHACASTNLSPPSPPPALLSNTSAAISAAARWRPPTS